ncbi:MAG: Cysteine-tRNA ligase [Candidatus Uhrbacteria bacterium GW2011_GWF2_39_13]|uniref:Cysteine--tRNA ligase n=1 Tax=Candidatus Uhrbacteria bacterium GW2011_GWF2_39_13 TaxID=1618995 RepID=A0A0G0MKA7_9BACT|nr:MAG: Cysteine-tRNA ligase [Candidatus Uhrbacteria bacterium GW2011_GWF2_39_13]
MIHLYNTLTRQKEEFISIHEGKVGIYSCGPTVYWFAHIGNMRSFLFADILRRTLELNGYEVKMVMNITDVGHLTGDLDDGEDKMLVAMRREGKTAEEIALFYTQAFMKDLAQLNIKPANIYPKATDHIPEQIQMVRQLEKNGFTYKTSDGIYFDTSKLSQYGRLSGQKSEEKKAGARVEMGEKRNTTDFALWKFSPQNSSRDMEWDSPWGVGFPGWHLECSAMSMKYLDVPFDIHTGGVDHIAVHHENEIAQTQADEGVLEANVWMHSEFLTVNDGKMSKSLGNLYTVEDLQDKGFDPLVYRYFVLGAHYRSKLNFTFEGLEAAKNALYKLRETVREWNQPEDGSSELEEAFIKALNDDLNTPQALAIVWELVNAPLPSSIKAHSLLWMDKVLGLRLEEFIAQPVQIPLEIQELVNEREEARIQKDWAKSDVLRKEIEQRGYFIEDTQQGTKVKKN